MKYLILGAGPAGLSFANKLKMAGIDSYIVLEKENEPGGLCRSRNVDGSPFDIGGGHFLDVRRKKINDFLFEFMPETEWNLFSRDSRIVVNGNEIGHPIEANIWQMKIEDQVAYLKSIAVAGCNTGVKMPEEFVNWIYWKLGDRIAKDYMIPYNSKMFNKELEELGTYWLEKLPNVSFEETLLSCLEKKPYGTQPGHAQFFYPKKYGYGELWKRMGDALGDKIKYCSDVYGLDYDNMLVKTSNGELYSADVIITTIPWKLFSEIKGMPENIKESIQHLKNSSVETRYYDKNMDTKAHWIYYPNLELAYHRILVRSNFCPNSRGYWTETNSQRLDLIPESEKDNYHYMNEYAYPLNTIEKPSIMKRLLSWSESRKVFGLGRWGEWQHYNSDVTVERALELADRLI
ncbi:protoporphyrinogen/coproporphyrinogen oxidase [Butyrivibrio fibrisolvens]|uniref:protoporphyrinogen/coproporphyrinogen oxidase n=1 Tax=Butyrivibrio fibrisolvens TaxID=831 RepID=UPI0003B5F256|nr:FAD-dependent oxidoreductase [Butyrivibrio fibrisolvens]